MKMVAFANDEYQFDIIATRLAEVGQLWICQDPEYTKILNISDFRVHHGSEYVRVLNMALILNMPGFWIY